MTKTTFAKIQDSGTIEKGRIESPENIFPIIVRSERVNVHEAWLEEPIVKAVDRSELVEMVRAGDPVAWLKYMEDAFRRQGMPSFFYKYAQPQDWYTAKYMAAEFEKGLDHRNLDTNIRTMRFDQYLESVGFLVPREDEDLYIADCAEAYQEMDTFSSHIKYKLQSRASRLGRVVTKPIVEEDIFLLPATYK